MNNSFTVQSSPFQLFFVRITTWNFIIYSLITLTGAVANGLLLLAAFKDPLKCFRSPTSYFVVNLAVSDFLNSLILFTELCLSLTHYGSVYGLPTLALNIYLPFFNFVFLLTFPSVFSVAVERFLAISRPLWHKVHLTRQVCRRWLTVLWIVNILYTGLTHAFYYKEFPMISQICELSYPSFFFMATLFINFYAYVSIRRHNEGLPTNDSSSENYRHTTEARLKSHNRFLFTVFIINITLVFCILPTLIILYFMTEEDDHGFGFSTNVILSVFFTALDILYILNSSGNPFVYIWRLPKYRRTFFVLYCERYTVLATFSCSECAISMCSEKARK